MSSKMRGERKSRVTATLMTIMSVFAFVLSPMYGIVADQVASAASFSVSDQSEFEAALSNQKPEISIDASFSVDKEMAIKYSTTINGNGNTITADFSYTDNDNNAPIGILDTSYVTINNLTVVRGANSSGLHGINVYESTDVNLDNVTIKNFNRGGVKYGLVVGQNSDVTVDNITTSGNSRGIDVDKGTPHLTVNGQSSHTESWAIYVDSNNENYVTDTNNQYRWHAGASFFGYVLLGGHESLLKAPATPEIDTPSNNNQKFSTTNKVKLEWAPSGDIYNRQDVYQWEIDLDGPKTQHTTVSESTNSYIFTKLPDGEYTAKVRAVAKSGAASDWAEVKFEVTYHYDNFPIIKSLTVHNHDGTTTDVKPASSGKTANVQPVLSGTQRIDINLENPEIIWHKWGTSWRLSLQLNHETNDGSNPINHDRQSFRAEKDSNGQFYVMVDTKSLSDGDGKYLYAVTANSKTKHHGYFPSYSGNSGNIGSWHLHGYHFIVDNEKPKIENVSIDPDVIGSKMSGEIKISATVTDSISGVDDISVHYKIYKKKDGKLKKVGSKVIPEGTLNSNGNDKYSKTLQPSDFKGLDSGKYVLRVDAKDNAGNHKNHTYVVFIVDNTAPIVKLTTSTNTDGSVGINASIEDKNLSHYYLSVWKDGTEVHNGDTFKKVPTTNGFTKQLLTTVSDDGDYTVRLAARDKANNKDGGGVTDGDSVKNTQFTIDRTQGPGMGGGENEGDTGEPADSNGSNNGGSQHTNANRGGETTPQVRQLVNPAFGAGAVSPVFTLPAETDDDATVLGDDTDGDETDGEVKADTDQTESGMLDGEEKDDGCSKLLGICWYWWIPIVIAIIAAIWWLATRNNEKEASA